MEMRIEDMIMVSVDDHICEPHDMFDAHVPAKFKDHAPHVVEEEDGSLQWWYGDIRGRQFGMQAAAGKPAEFIAADAIRYEEMRPGCFNVHERVRDMSAGGQLAGLNFPNWPGFAAPVLNQGPDRTVNEVMIKAYNDWHVDEWCGAYPGRFIPCGILPLFDVDRCAAEVRRLADKGCHVVTFSENPQTLHLPSIHTPYWDPLLSACCDVGTVLALHLGSSSRSFSAPADAPAGIAANFSLTITSAMTISTLIDFMWSDIWDRFPQLMVSLTEGDIGWIPYFVWRAEWVHKRHSPWTKVTFPDGEGPRKRFFDHIVPCFIQDPVGLKLLDEFNLDNLCWESDYPHSDSTWPNAPEVLLPQLEQAQVTDDVIDRVTHRNAMRLYQFDPFAHRDRDQCTVGALRAEAIDVDTVTHVGWKRVGSDIDEAERHARRLLRPKAG
jgi:predicted TIM-barrel fold metal-dependent hydrolase